MDPFLGQIKIFAFPFAPKGWAVCDGRLMPINQYQALFSLLGTMYGGNGQTTFGLPNLQGRVPLHVGTDGTYVQGAALGEPQHVLVGGEMPAQWAHTHAGIAVNNPTDQTDVTGHLLGNAPGQLYAPFNRATAVALMDGSISLSAGGGGHENMMPFLALNICIALQGIYPSRD